MKIIKKILPLLLTLLLTTSCGSIKTYYAYTIYPIEYLLNKIGGDKIQIKSIQDNQHVQVAQLKEDYYETLKDSNFFFHVGNLEPYYDLYQEEITESGVSSVDLSTLNAIYDFKRFTPVYLNGNISWIESEYYEGDAFNMVDTYDKDLFIWLDPIGMLSMAKDVYTTLRNNYVEQADYFEANYIALENDLVELSGNYQKLANTLQAKNQVLKFVSMTPSFGMWQKAYGFSVYPICISKYGALPTEDQLTIIKQRIKDDDVQYIVYEPNMTEEMSSLFQELEEELDLKRIVISNLSSLSSTQSAEFKDYLSIMKDNLSALESMAEELTEQ